MKKAIFSLIIICCLLTSSLLDAQDAPRTMMPEITFCNSISSVSVPVKVSSFNEIGAISLTLHYDSDVINYLNFANNSGFPGLSVNCPTPGTIIVGGYIASGNQGFSLNDSSVLCTLNFSYLGGTSLLEWYDDGVSCEYAGAPPSLPTLNDLPQCDYYVNGLVSQLSLPSPTGPISGPVEGKVCQGQTGVIFSVNPVLNAEYYFWTLPAGASVFSGQNTNQIVVDFTEEASSGNVVVHANNDCGSGDSSSMAIILLGIPEDAGSITGAQIVCQGQDQLNYTIDPVNMADSYTWVCPPGAWISGGINTNSIIVDYANTASNGLFMVYASNVCGNGSGSPPFPVEVEMIPQILTQPVSSNEIIAGVESAFFTFNSAGTDLEYHWQEFTSSWIDLEESVLYQGVHSDSLLIVKPPFSLNGNRYRCRVTGLCPPEIVTDGLASLNLSLPVKMEEFDLSDKEFSVYPNPFSDFLIINLPYKNSGLVSASIFGIEGNLLLSTKKQLFVPGTKSITIEPKLLQQGTYIIKVLIETENNSTTCCRLIQCIR